MNFLVIGCFALIDPLFESYASYNICHVHNSQHQYINTYSIKLLTKTRFEWVIKIKKKEEEKTDRKIKKMRKQGNQFSRSDWTTTPKVQNTNTTWERWVERTGKSLMDKYMRELEIPSSKMGLSHHHRIWYGSDR